VKVSLKLWRGYIAATHRFAPFSLFSVLHFAFAVLFTANVVGYIWGAAT
jgi:hypothetical protein